MLLEHCTWPDVEAYLRRSKGILVPVGSVEQHGPTGLMGTDAMCAEAVAVGAGEAADALVGPTIRVGQAQHHLAFPGTVTLRPSTLMAVVEDYAASLARHGFERMLLVNGHGGNIATLHAAFAGIHAAASLAGRPSSLRVRMTSWWDPRGVRDLIREFFGDADGSHATASEIAMTQHLLPDTIRSAADLEPKRGPAGGGFSDALDFRRRYPDGRMGSDPSLATPERGGRLLAAAVAGLAETYRGFVAEG